jgi:hypothetical protein
MTPIYADRKAISSTASSLGNSVDCRGPSIEKRAIKHLRKVIEDGQRTPNLPARFRSEAAPLLHVCQPAADLRDSVNEQVLDVVDHSLRRNDRNYDDVAEVFKLLHCPTMFFSEAAKGLIWRLHSRAHSNVGDLLDLRGRKFIQGPVKRCIVAKPVNDPAGKGSAWARTPDVLEPSQTARKTLKE